MKNAALLAIAVAFVASLSASSATYAAPIKLVPAVSASDSNVVQIKMSKKKMMMKKKMMKKM